MPVPALSYRNQKQERRWEEPAVGLQATLPLHRGIASPWCPSAHFGVLAAGVFAQGSGSANVLYCVGFPVPFPPSTQSTLKPGLATLKGQWWSGLE